MTTIASLANELGCQPYELAAFADLGNMPQDQEIDREKEAMIREAWAQAPEGPVDARAENLAEERVLDDVAEILDRSGY